MGFDSVPPAPNSSTGSRSRRTEPSIDFDAYDKVPSSDEPSIGRREGENPLLFMFERFEKSLSTLRQYGLDHPEGIGKTRVIHRAFLDALQANPDGISFQVHPFCMSDGAETVWEPGPPNDQIPYGLASSGVEEVRILRGVTAREVREFLQITLIEPQLGLTEGDLGAALWEAGFEHITCRVRDDLADADARDQIRFFSESSEVEADVRADLAKVVGMHAQGGKGEEQAADKAEAAAMAMGTNTSMFEAAKIASNVMRLDYAAAKAMSAELSLEPNEWRSRFYALSAESLADAAQREDISILFDELNVYANRWVKAGQWDTLIEVYDALTSTLARYQKTTPTKVLPGHLTRQVFTWPRLAAAFGYLDSHDADPQTAKRLMEVVSLALSSLDGNMVAPMLRMADNLVAGPLCELALSYVGLHLASRKQEILTELDNLRPDLAQRVLGALTHERTDANRELLTPLLMSPNPALRCEATALLAQSPMELGIQLVRLLASHDPRLRAAALTTMVRHDVRHAGPGLVQSIEDDSALKRPDAELRKMFEALYALHPSRAESLLVAILDDHGLIANEALDRKRTVAAEVLGKKADSANSLDALDGASRIRPWNTQQLRTAATDAANKLRLRLADETVSGGTS